MKIVSYEVNGNNIVLKFDSAFYQIKYLKMTRESQDNLCQGELECDETEIKFTKQKQSIIVYLDSNLDSNLDLIIFLIKEIDNNNCNYSYFINLCKSNSSNTNNARNDNLFSLGIAKLLLGGGEEKIENTKNRNIFANTKECPIKNRNIFANIKRKG